MWYFAWMLGIGFAVLLSILNAMWLESQQDRGALDEEEAPARLVRRTRP